MSVDAETAAAFQSFDANNDGVLDEGELMGMTQQLGFAVDEAYILNMVASFGEPGRCAASTSSTWYSICVYCTDLDSAV